MSNIMLKLQSCLCGLNFYDFLCCLTSYYSLPLDEQATSLCDHYTGRWGQFQSRFNGFCNQPEIMITDTIKSPIHLGKSIKSTTLRVWYDVRWTVIFHGNIG